jgi:hypothetical protein
MKIQPSTLGWLAVTGALAVALALSHWPRPGSGDKVPAEVQRSADSLELTRPATEDRRDSILRLVVVDTARAVRAERLAKARKDTAEGFRKRADSSAALASVYGDSAFLWRDAYENRTAEADQLRLAFAAADSARAAEAMARARFDQLFRDSEARRRVAEEVVIPGLQRAISQLEKPCRLVGPIRCPSRTETALLTVAVGIAAGRASK